MKDLLSKINQKKIAQYQAHLEKLELSEATIKRRLSTLRKFYNWAEKEGYLKKLPQRAPAIKEIPSIKRLQFLTSKLRPSLPPMPTIPYISDAYEIYQSISITKYLHYAILIIFCVGLGMGIYYQLTGPKAEPIGAYPTALTPPKRYLSFQGRLTDSSNNPITDSTDFVFKLYNAEGTGCPPSGGVQLWSGSCSIDPDEDGIFSVLLGSDCGSEISESVFSENADVWLEITVGTDPYDEILCPRIQIATVGYALNAETLQGYPPGTGINRIPYIDNTGKITIAAASPTIESTSGTFAITGQALSITTATGSNGNIVLAPDGVGTLNINVGGTGPGNQVRITDANISAGNLVSVYAGTSATGFNLLNLSSGTPETTVFSVDESGNTYVAGNVGIGTTAPGATLEVVGDIKIGTLASGSTNDVLIHSGNIVQQRTIDSRVWGSTLVDYSGTSANYIPKMSDTETITNSIIYETGGQIGIGTTNPGATLEVAGGGVKIPSATANTTTLNLGNTVDLYGRTTSGSEGLVISHTAGDVSITLENNQSMATPLKYKADQTDHFSVIPASYFDLYFFEEATSGQNKSLRIYGYPTGGTLNYANLQIIGTNNDLQISTNKASSDIILTPSSYVGIGTNDPESILHIKSSTANSGLTIQTGENTNNQGIAFENSAGSYTWHIYRADAGSNYADLRFASGLTTLSGLTDRVTFTADGNVGIGTTSPAYLLDVSGNVNIGGTGTIGNIPLVSDNNRVLTSSGVGSGEIQYINTSDWDKDSGDDYSAWLLAGDSGTVQTIGSGDTVSLVGGIGIGTTSSATDTLTINVDQSYGFAWTGAQSWSNTATFNGTLDANGDVTLGDGGDQVSITDDNWSISSAGAISGITTLSMSNQLTNSYANTAAINLTGAGAGITFGSSGPYQIITGGSTDLALMPGGNVGIGTTGPGTAFVVDGLDTAIGIGDEDGAGTPNAGIQFLDAGNRHVGLRFDGSKLIYEDASASRLPSTWYNNATADFIVRNGSVGIGTTDPGSYNLNVAGTAAFDNAGVIIDSNSYVNANRFVDMGSNYYIDPAHTTISGLFAGKVGIGTTDPGAPLDVLGEVQIADGNTAKISIFGTAGSETAGENSIYESGGTFNFTSEKGFQFGIDNDDNGANFFKIYSGGIGGTEIYQVNENGDLTMSGDLTVSGGNLALNSSIDTGDDIQIDPVSGGADAYLDIYNTDGLATLYIQNDSGTYAVDVDIEGDLIVSGGNLAVGTTKQNARAINAAIDYASGVSNAIGGYFDADVSGTGTGSPRGIQIYADITNASNTSDVYGIYIPSLSTTSTAGGNVYGIYTANPTTAGTGNLYAAYFDGANANVYMGGDLTVNGGDITGANGETIDIGEAINNRIQVNADASGGYFQLGDNLNLLSAKDTYFDIWGTTDRTLTIYNSDSTYVVDVSLEDDLTVGGNLTVGSDLTVSGNDIWGGTDSTLRIETDENLSVYLDRDADVAGQFVVFDDADAAVFRAYETGRLWGGSFTSSGTKALCLSDATPADGGYINDCSGTPEADIAEYYGTPIDSGPGDLMSLDQSQALMFKKADQAYSPNIIGIISTAPIGPLGEILGDKTIPEDRNPQPLSLTGRVPIKVSLENGPIAIGDPLTSSSTPGVAMKATKAGVIIGRALENYDGSIQISPGVTLQEQHRFEETGEVIPLPPEGIGKILVYFNPSWYDPDVYLVDTGDIQITQSIGESENQNIGESEKFSLVDAAGEVIERIGVFSEAVIAELRVGLIKTQEIITKKLASQEVTTEKLISPLIETQEIKTERISLQEIETEPGEDIVFNLQEASESGFGKLVVNGKGGEEVASIDAEGNATFAGELHAKKVVAEEIVGLEGKFGELLAATVSAQKIEGLEERLAQLESEPSPSPTASPKSEPPATESGDPMNDVELSPDIEALVNEILGTSLEATPQAELAYTEGEDLNIINSLTVLGTTSLADTSIAGSLNVGGTMSLTDNSINSLTGTLYLQNLGLGGIDILAGKVTIDEQGNAVFEGDVTIKGRLALSEIEPLPGEESIVIDLSPEEEQPETESKFGKLLIRGVDDEIVASIEASGTATFKKLAIAKAEEEVTQISETEIETNATAGTAVLKAGETELTVKNSNITDKSLIYLTPISDTENKVLFVEAKKAHQEAILDDSGLETIPEEIGWFKVAIDVAIDTDIQFNWWIIN